jgi:hypothetical protein
VPDGAPLTTAVACDLREALSEAGVTEPYSPSATARIPATAGVAIEVPEMVLVAVVLPIHALRTLTPSAQTSTTARFRSKISLHSTENEGELTAIVGERSLRVRALNRTNGVGSSDTGGRGRARIDVAVSGSDSEVNAFGDRVGDCSIDCRVGSTTERHRGDYSEVISNLCSS